MHLGGDENHTSGLKICWHRRAGIESFFGVKFTSAPNTRRSSAIADSSLLIAESTACVERSPGFQLLSKLAAAWMRTEAELKNFRTRVERDRAANRELVIAEVLRTLLPAIDDLDRADAHGDLVEGSPLTLVAQKLRAAFVLYDTAKKIKTARLRQLHRNGARNRCNAK